MINGFMFSQNTVLFLPTLAYAPVFHNLLCLLPKSHAPQKALMVSSP